MKNSKQLLMISKYASLALMVVVFALQFVPFWDGVSIARFLAFPEKVTATVKEVIEAYQEVLANGYKLGTKATKLYNKLDSIGTTAGHYYKGVE